MSGLLLIGCAPLSSSSALDRRLFSLVLNASYNAVGQEQNLTKGASYVPHAVLHDVPVANLRPD